MFSAIITSIIGYFAGSILWRIATIMAAIGVIIWLAKRLRKGPKGEQAEGKEFGALIMLIAIAGAAAGLGFGAVDRAAESVQHANALNAVQAQNQSLAADLSAANERAEVLRLAADRNLKLAEAAEKRAESINRRLTASQRARAETTRRITRSAERVSQNPDGSTPVVSRDWLLQYNKALGFDLPAPAAPTSQPGGAADATDSAAAGAVRESATGSGAQSVEAGLLDSDKPVTVADVLVTHTVNAEAARDASERLEAIQIWYEALRSERNSQQEDGNDD